MENGYYHIYNRGVDKRDIFIDEKDYVVFLGLLKRYLTPFQPRADFQAHTENSFRAFEVRPGYRSDLYDKITLVCYCLMPNHLHLMVKQTTKKAITDFMRALMNSYVFYFNKRYERTGTLFEGRFKGVLVETEPYLLHLTRYIHLNPLDLVLENEDQIKYVREYPYSSYQNYLGMRRAEWVQPHEILSFFKSAQRMGLRDVLSYQSFVEDYRDDSREILSEVALD